MTDRSLCTDPHVEYRNNTRAPSSLATNEERDHIDFIENEAEYRNNSISSAPSSPTPPLVLSSNVITRSLSTTEPVLSMDSSSQRFSQLSTAHGSHSPPNARVETHSLSEQHAESVEIRLDSLDDSLDASDTPFCQEPRLSSPTSSESSKGSLSDSVQITRAEIESLCSASRVSTILQSSCDSGGDLCEDIYSRLFTDFDDERYVNMPWEDLMETDVTGDTAPCLDQELETRISNHQNGGLPNWDYDSPFSSMQVKIDDVDETLGFRFVREANTVLDNVIEDIHSGRVSRNRDNIVAMTPLSCLETFITDCLLEKLVSYANRVLAFRHKETTDRFELRGIVILHALCAMYNESPTTVCDPEEHEHFFQMGISADRYHEVWSALSGGREKRNVHDYSATGWCRSANRATSMITVVESEIASINRELLYVPNATVLSLDDDHLRMSSRAVLNLTYLQQHNNPKKGLGPVGNALCSALNPLFIACHFTRNGEKLCHIWERLAQLLQGASTNGALRAMPEAIFAADRGYNSKETIEFVGAVLGASLIGTHKRDLWYPYVFGDGPITARHKGVLVSEKGCRAVYNARLKSNSQSKASARQVEACIYRESCSGRIAALVHNNASMFPSRCFTVVLKEAFRTDAALKELEESLVVFNTRSDPFAQTRSTFSEEGRQVVSQALQRVVPLTYLQSEDPVWFLLRAFRFTSRTTHGFLAAVARDYDTRITGMAVQLRGRRISEGANELPNDVTETKDCITERWTAILDTLSIRKQIIERPSDRRTLAERVSGYSQSRINSFTKSDLQSILSVFDRRVDIRKPKSELVSAVLQLKQDIIDETVNLEGGDAGELSEEAMFSAASKSVRRALQEASISAWVMKPLVSTMGMREGSRNEIEVAKALAAFFEKQKGAFAKKLFCATYAFDNSIRLKLLHLRSTGLLESKSCRLLADSPDGIAAAANGEGMNEVFAVEIKTMTSLATIQVASAKASKYGEFIVLSDVGSDRQSTELFHKLVPTTPYRSQCLHHAATLGLNTVLFVVATGGSLTGGRILYSCLIHFTEAIRHQYTYTLDCVRHTAFGWIGGEAKDVPSDYDDMLQHTHASDIHSFMSYYSLSEALRKCVERRNEPLPPARMIRLTPTVYWNHLKGGVDVISRYMKTLARCNISENPVVSIIARLLSMQISNAAVLYRLNCARKLKQLPAIDTYENSTNKGYHYLRHKISQSETFGKFIRKLAKEWTEKKTVRQEQRNVENRRQLNSLTPLFSRNAAEKYNIGIHKARRLNSTLLHEPVSAKATYCVLCTWDLRGFKNGKLKVKRKGSRQVQWCRVCRQAVCASCWDAWNTKTTLKRAAPSETEKRNFEASLRSIRQRVV